MRNEARLMEYFGDKNEEVMLRFEDFLTGFDGETDTSVVVEGLRNEFGGFTIHIEHDPDPVKLGDRQVWSCDSGEGEVTPIPLWRHFALTVEKGKVTYAEINKIWGSPTVRQGGDIVSRFGCVVWDDDIEDILPETQLYGG